MERVVKKFDSELMELQNRMSQMASLAQSMVALAITAIQDRGKNVRKEVDQLETTLDQMQMDIDRDAIRMLTVYGPVATQLRYVLGVSNITMQLERIGDQVVNICESLDLMQTEIGHHVQPDLHKMAATVGEMIDAAFNAYFERDASSLTHQQRNNLAASFQDAATGALISKVERAIHQMDHAGCRPQSLIIGGGVCANSLLRERVKQLPQKHHDIQVFLPPLPLCLDNAAMIAGLAYEHLRHHRTDELSLPAMATTSGIAKTSCTGKFAHRKALS